MIKTIVDKIAQRVRLGYLTAFIILLITYIVSFIATQNVMRQARLVNHSSEVVHRLENIVSYVTQSESEARGYLITSRQDLKYQYFQRKASADSAMSTLRLMTYDNPPQNRELDTLSGLMGEKFSWIERQFGTFDSAHIISKGILDAAEQGILRMNRVEDYALKMETQERQLWIHQDAQFTRYSNLIRIFNIVSLVVAILFTIYSLLTFNKENKEKQEANAEADSYRKQLELQVKKLEAMNQELIELREIEKFASTGRIARTIAHEVRNPLTNINLATEQLSHEMPATPEVSLLLEMISRNSKRINQLINDLLSATRKSELSLERAYLNELLDHSLEYAMDRIELKHIRVKKNYVADECPVMVDVPKIELAFLNIIVNAIESMEDHGLLVISTSLKNDRCQVAISDTGKGIDKAQMDRLFEPYYTTKERGTGLGLTHTQNIILAHSASISVESESGKGTTMTLSFERAPALTEAPFPAH